MVVPGRVELPTHPCEGYVITVSPRNFEIILMVVPGRVELPTHPCQGYVITVSPRNCSYLKSDNIIIILFYMSKQNFGLADYFVDVCFC